MINELTCLKTLDFEVLLIEWTSDYPLTEPYANPSYGTNDTICP